MTGVVRRVRAAAVATCAVVVAVVAAGCSVPLPGSTTGTGSSRTTAPAPRTSASAARRPVAAGRTLPTFATSGPAVTSAVRGARTSIVKITGVATACSQIQEGSGFVVAPGRVLTNAHVVQGVRTEQVQVGGSGRRYSAVVVLYRPDIDLAVLRVRSLKARALPLVPQDLPDGAVVAAAGFPLNGAFRLDGGSVQDVGSTAGPVVGGVPAAARPVYTVKIRIRPGNSGGPLLLPDGRVAGVVFAKEKDTDKQGYAITSAAAAKVVAAASTRTSRVSTGRCG